MKKTLLVAAMMASFTGAAVAQNSVTLYGRLSPAMVYESVKFNDQAAATVGKTRLPNGAGTYNQFSNADGYNGAGSLYGFRGVEDLGNGLKASFVFENGLTTTTGATSSRVAALTIAGTSWGSVGFGRDVAAGNTLLAGLDALGAGAYGVGNATNALGVTSIRVSNQVKYLSPSFSGLSFGATYVFSGVSMGNAAATRESFGTSTQNRLIQGGFRYANGPIVAAALYTLVNPANNVFDKKVKNWTVGGTYDLKVVKIHAAYGQNIDGIITGQTNPGIISGNFGQTGAGALVASGRTNQWSLGLSAPVGASGNVAFSFAQLRLGGNFKTANTDTQTSTGISYTYSLSKRTSLYAGYSYAKNQTGIKGITVNQLGGGLYHTF